MTDAPRPTSRDVARRAGVSRATVSYVLNRVAGARIPEGTRSRVLAAAEELGYAPSMAGRALVSGRSDLVVLLMPDMPVGEPALRLVDALGRALAGHGLTLTVHFDTPGGPPLGRLAAMLSVRAVVSLHPLGREERAQLRAAGAEVVVAHGAGTAADADGVDPLNDHVGRLQVLHLAGRGHRRLVFAAPAEDRLRRWVQGRRAGVTRACAELGLPAPVPFTVPDDPGAAVDAVRELRDREPGATAVCAYNDDVALVLLHGLRGCGVAVPAQVAVVGVDDLRASAVSVPPLTTVGIAPEAGGRRTAELVVAALAGTPGPAQAATEAVRLVVRDSS